METLEQKIARVLKDHVELVPYDPRWPDRFAAEREHLRACLPADLLGRIEHFGSTAVPELAAKPVIDVLIEVRDLEEANRIVPPILEPQGYDCFWRAAHDDDQPPFYVWCIKRDPHGQRTHHLHMVEPHFDHWERLDFRDYLIAHPEVAREYSDLKHELARRHPDDREAYTRAKGEFVRRTTERAKRWRAGTRP